MSEINRIRIIHPSGKKKQSLKPKERKRERQRESGRYRERESAVDTERERKIAVDTERERVEQGRVRERMKNIKQKEFNNQPINLTDRTTYQLSN